ncbi:prepilin-type N-terminal cleavage/methylation domain-containing protein [Limisalsivibrio acetivorans]|uniref:prepilin-type N-terminal cleavage/methylation domain-containing protein n=1 Tax=Limisalsivibrio acetivorans TaxID=1304888 RepID=UPI0003B3D2A8|nr:prepilin-type N-terminal cleavage/methylation domain-containing protein [Limisalsivibrio acetivorans]
MAGRLHSDFKGKKDKKGFTLVEMAIVLVIVGLLLGLGSAAVVALTKTAKVRKTKEILDSTQDGLSSYIEENSELPSTSEIQSILSGFQDGFGKDVGYHPAPNLLNADDVCNANSTGLSVSIGGNTVNDVAYIIISAGENKNPQTGISGGTYTIQPEGTMVDDNTDGINRVESYDDIIRFATLGELKLNADCGEKRLRILNEELPFGVTGEEYNVEFLADGGVTGGVGGTSYEWCVDAYGDDNISGMTFGGGVIDDTNNCDRDLAVYYEAPSLELDNADNTPASPGAFRFTVHVRDFLDTSGTDDNYASRDYVLTVHPTLNTGQDVYSKERAKIDQVKEIVQTYINAEGSLPGDNDGDYGNSDGVISTDEANTAYNELINQGYAEYDDFVSPIMPDRYYVFTQCTPEPYGFVATSDTYEGQPHTNTCVYISDTHMADIPPGTEPNVKAISYRDFCEYEKGLDDSDINIGEVRRVYNPNNDNGCQTDFHDCDVDNNVEPTGLNNCTGGDYDFNPVISAYADADECRKEESDRPTQKWCNTVIIQIY